MDENFTYFQYHRDLKYPVYIKVQLNQFDPSLPNLLSKMNFISLNDEEVKSIDQQLDDEPKARVLTLKVASNRVARHVDFAIESDRYGQESIIPKEGYRLYRYKNMGLMVYSFVTQNWELGAHVKFGAEDQSHISRIMLNRFLAWSLYQFSIIGVWGVPVDEGVVILGQKESLGEAVYIDLKNFKVISEDGVSSFPSRFKILRLDSTLKDRYIIMNQGQLSSFLATQSTFLDYSGLHVPVRQLIKTLSTMSEGVVHPRDLFRPRTDLNP